MSQHNWQQIERATHALSFYFKPKVISILLFSLLLLSCSSVSRESVDSLLIKSVGGLGAVKKIYSLKSYRMAGKINWNGLDGSYEGLFKSPNKVKITADFGNFSIIQGFDGTVAWQKDIHGRVFELSTFEKKEFMRSVYFMTFKYLKPPLSGTLGHLLDSAEFQNQNFYKVLLLPYAPYFDDTITCLFDSKNGLLISQTSRLDNLIVETKLSDYKLVNGIQIPFYSISTAANTPMITEIAIDTTMFDIELNDAQFVKPIVDLKDFYFPPDSNSVTIPIIYRNGHVLIPVEINGVKRGWFILDTGASATYYDSKFTASLGLHSIGSLPSMGLGGYEQIQLVNVDSLSIGKLTLFNQTAGVLPLDNLGQFSNVRTEFGGILGYDFFMRFPVMVDFKRQQLTIFNPQKNTLPENGIPHPLHLTMMIPTIGAQIGRESGEFLIDLGNALGLIIHKKYGEKLVSLAIVDTTGSPVTSIAGIGPGVLGKNVEVNSMQIDAHNIRIPESILAESSEGLTGSWEIAGNIGTRILEQYAILFDYPASQVIFYELKE